MCQLHACAILIIRKGHYYFVSPFKSDKHLKGLLLLLEVLQSLLITSSANSALVTLVLIRDFCFPLRTQDIVGSECGVDKFSITPQCQATIHSHPTVVISFHIRH